MDLHSRLPTSRPVKISCCSRTPLSGRLHVLWDSQSTPFLANLCPISSQTVSLRRPVFFFHPLPGLSLSGSVGTPAWCVLLLLMKRRCFSRSLSILFLFFGRSSFYFAYGFFLRLDFTLPGFWFFWMTFFSPQSLFFCLQYLLYFTPLAVVLWTP